MKVVTKLVGCLISSMFFLESALAEPPNLSIIKQEVKQYHDSGFYDKELSTIINEADSYIVKQAKINHGKKKLAIVLDIDETVLSNYAHIVQRDFAADTKEIHQNILKGDAPVIKPMLSLYKDALKHHVKVFFVTGRHISELGATKKNLVEAGYTEWSGLYLRPDNYHASSIIPFKSKTRELITQKGFTIIASIGDQYSDLIGGYAKKTFKLPNPFYFLP